MFKKLKVPLIFLLVILLSYSWVWYESYQRARIYYNNAVNNYQQGNYITAIKGEQVLKDDKSGYIFKGGFQQVEDIWQSPYAIPKPDLYQQAQEKIRIIIDNKIDINMGENIFHKYFRLDNKYLPQIMLRVGDLYLKQGKIDKAKEAYELVNQAFSRNKEIAKKAKNKLSELKNN